LSLNFMAQATTSIIDEAGIAVFLSHLGRVASRCGVVEVVANVCVRLTYLSTS